MILLKVYVKSTTEIGGKSHPRGSEVIAEIVKANIPVANGVAHLISRPLAIVSSNLWSYLEKEVN